MNPARWFVALALAAAACAAQADSVDTLRAFVRDVQSGAADFCRLWARIEPLGGREGFGQQQWVATGEVRFTIRWRDDVTPLHRVVHEGREYDVVSVAEDGRREALLIVGRARTEGRVP